MIRNLRLWFEKMRQPTLPQEKLEQITAVQARQRAIERRVRLMELELRLFRMDGVKNAAYR